MAPDPALRPPGAGLEKLKTSIVQAYANSQLFLAFAIQRQQSKVKILDAPFKVGDVESYVHKLSEGEKQLLQAADDCERHCDLSSRRELHQLATDFRQIIQDQVYVSKTSSIRGVLMSPEAS